MRTRSVTVAMSIVVALVLAPAVQAATTPVDYAQTARNIIPSGEPGGFPFPAGADTQAKMYNALTPLGGHVTAGDLFSDFKSEVFGLGTDGPGTIEPVPYPGVTIIRDRFDVPHVSATTHDGGVWASGWIAAEDRGLLLQQARYDSLVAAIDAPGLSAIGLVESLKNFVPSAQTENVVVARQTQVLLKAGPEGRAVLHDIDVYVTGLNAYLRATNSTRRRSPATTSTPSMRSRTSSSVRVAATRPAARSFSPVSSGGSGRQGLQRLQRSAPEPERREPDDRRRELQLTSSRRRAGRAGQRRPEPRKLPRRRRRCRRPLQPACRRSSRASRRATS